MKRYYDRSRLTKETIYDLMNGEIDLEYFPIPESAIIQNEFATGSICDKAYQSAMAAYSSLCRRLQDEIPEDPDVEDMLYQLAVITRHMALKMYDYGAYFGTLEQHRWRIPKRIVVHHIGV